MTLDEFLPRLEALETAVKRRYWGAMMARANAGMLRQNESGPPIHASGCRCGHCVPDVPLGSVDEQPATPRRPRRSLPAATIEIAQELDLRPWMVERMSRRGVLLRARLHASMAGPLPPTLREELDALPWTKLSELITDGVPLRLLQVALGRVPRHERRGLECAIGRRIFNSTPERPSRHPAWPSWDELASGRFRF
jgi:hypothetical protein